LHHALLMEADEFFIQSFTHNI